MNYNIHRHDLRPLGKCFSGSGLLTLVIFYQDIQQNSYSPIGIASWYIIILDTSRVTQ